MHDPNSAQEVEVIDLVSESEDEDEDEDDMDMEVPQPVRRSTSELIEDLLSAPLADFDVPSAADISTFPMPVAMPEAMQQEPQGSTIDCPVCFEPMGRENQNPMCVLGCRHACCTNCIEGIKQTGRRQCPICKKPFTARTVRELFV